MSTLESTNSFIPPFCPNSRCEFHYGGKDFFKRNGTIKTNKAPFFNQRFKCRHCDYQFSKNTFSLDFRKRLPKINEQIFNFSMHGMTNRSIARILGVREKVVRNRLAHLSRQAQMFEKEHQRKIKIKEPVSYDGFETFTGSQFSPCYINTAVGGKSLFTYVVSFSPLNRKGRMTQWQKEKNRELQKEFGKYPSDSVSKLTKYTYKRLLEHSIKLPIIINTDEHKAYEFVMNSSFKDAFTHFKTNSKERRDTKNPLFSVNHLHLNYRHFLASNRRETIAFNKHEAGLMDRIILMKTYKNFMRTKILKDRGKDSKSPAMELGLCNKVLEFSEVFPKRRFKDHYEFDEVEEDMFERYYPYSRKVINSYQGV